jgi:4-methyl-5(b-hydroxyethyl)-thiazole monophosphate biosynthesis
MSRVLVPLAEGFEEMEGIILVDVLRRAEIEVVTAALSAGTITAARRTKHLADLLLEEVKEQAFDMIALPGGAAGARNLENSKTLNEMLLRMQDRSGWIAAVCAAPNVLRRAGIIKGDDPYTQHPNSIKDGQGGGRYTGERVVVHGRVITSMGPGTSFEFALKIVEILCGSQMRERVAGPLYL